MIILDFSGGESCRNDIDEAYRMIDALAAVDSRRENVIIKWQLFTSNPMGAAPLKPGVFAMAYDYAWWKHQYWTTASVFDEDSLTELLNFNVPFVKLAARPATYHLLERIPKNLTVFVSFAPGFCPDEIRKLHPNVKPLYCIPEYPANPTVYETQFGRNLSYGISDHTPDFYLYHKFQPWYYETHFRLPDSGGLDSGPWSKTPAMLSEIL